MFRVGGGAEELKRLEEIMFVVKPDASAAAAAVAEAAADPGRKKGIVRNCMFQSV